MFLNDSFQSSFELRIPQSAKILSIQQIFGVPSNDLAACACVKNQHSEEEIWNAYGNPNHESQYHLSRVEELVQTRRAQPQASQAQNESSERRV